MTMGSLCYSRYFFHDETLFGSTISAIYNMYGNAWIPTVHLNRL